MGVKHFFHWFKDRFASNISKMGKRESLSKFNISVDNFMIDMNGIFHTSAQKIYEYGEYKPLPRLMSRKRPSRDNRGQKQTKMFEDVCTTVESLFNIVKPKKRLILCVDGPAPLSKQRQQRQRRFKTALDSNPECPFDSNCITPGTLFMDNLTRYIDWFLKKKISEDPLWKRIEVIFSNEKAKGEGEHKLLYYIRMHGDPNETYCIHGMDADLIMLSLGTGLKNFYILRDDTYEDDYFLINIGGTRADLSDFLRWEGEFDGDNAIVDFIFMCFLVGNDFLPHIPTIEIIEGGIDCMVHIYKKVSSKHGHLTIKRENGDIKFSKPALKSFFKKVSKFEGETLVKKFEHKDSVFPDPILERAMTFSEGKYEIDLKTYRREYYRINLPETKGEKKNIEKVCHDYLEGLQWVLSYYTKGVPDWKWYFPHHYAPFSKSLSSSMDTFNFSVYGESTASLPFIQLLSVLPPKSSYLLPKPLDGLLKGALRDYCPEQFGIDLSGKRKEWEGVILLPMVDTDVVQREYCKIAENVDPRDKRRNVIGKSYVYNFTEDNPYTFHSKFGDFACTVSVEPIQL